MNCAQLKLTAVFLVFAVIGFGPVSPGCLIGMFVITTRPPWFLRLMHDLYADQSLKGQWWPGPWIRLQSFLVVLTLFVIDALPYPVTPSIVLPLIFIRPCWLFRVVEGIYSAPFRR